MQHARQRFPFKFFSSTCRTSCFEISSHKPTLAMRSPAEAPSAAAAAAVIPISTKFAITLTGRIQSLITSICFEAELPEAGQLLFFEYLCLVFEQGGGNHFF